MSTKKMIIAHAGAKGFAPENTLLAFEKAIDLGADMIEIDVRVIEGKCVLFHDRRMDRVTSLKGLLTNYSVDQLRDIRFDHDQQIPFLDEALETIDRRVPVNIELKSLEGMDVLCSVVQTFLSRGWQSDDFLFSSFNHHHLLAFKDRFPQLPLGALISCIPLDYCDFISTLGCRSIHCSASFINQAFIDDAHRRGLKVYIYTVNLAQERDRLFKMGVDGIFTDCLFT